jgi:hypothetical protein
MPVSIAGDDVPAEILSAESLVSVTVSGDAVVVVTTRSAVLLSGAATVSATVLVVATVGVPSVDIFWGWQAPRSPAVTISVMEDKGAKDKVSKRGKYINDVPWPNGSY